MLANRARLDKLLVMQRLAALLLLLSLAFAAGEVQNRPIVVVNQTHVFHTPLAMTEIVGSLGVQSLGGIGLDLSTYAEIGGYVEYHEWRGRMAATGSLGLSGGHVCYTGALDWLGYTYEAEITYRIRFGGGGGIRVCYPVSDEKKDFKVLPLVEGVANLQLRVVPNVIADVTLMAGFPNGVGGAVGFALAY